jgi:hypothetical protein
MTILATHIPSGEADILASNSYVVQSGIGVGRGEVGEDSGVSLGSGTLVLVGMMTSVAFTVGEEVWTGTCRVGVAPGCTSAVWQAESSRIRTAKKNQGG